MARILIADDNDELLELHRVFLGQNGHEVLTARNGEEAMQLIATEPVDLLITDVIMPDKEGIETILELRRTRPTLPIIAISGGGHVGPDDYLRLATAAGAKAALSKPCPPSVLLSTIKSVLHLPN